MFLRSMFVLLTISALAIPSLAAEDKPKDDKAKAEAPVASTNEVPGLKIPASFTVNYDEGFVVLTAETKGTSVKWLVLSTANKVKYKINPQVPNEITIGITPSESVIAVFCVAVVDSKLTDFARCDVSVTGPPVDPNPQPTPDPVAKLKLPLHVTFVEDPASRTPSTKAILESNELATKLTQKGCVRRVYSINDPVIKARGLDKAVTKAGSLPALIIQDADGKLILAAPLPATATNVYDIVMKILEGK